jgi:hypothetical protein
MAERSDPSACFQPGNTLSLIIASEKHYSGFEKTL